jgi:hypothetical protein
VAKGRVRGALAPVATIFMHCKPAPQCAVEVISSIVVANADSQLDILRKP